MVQEPDKEWRSRRELASAVADLTGLGVEKCRKGISALIELGSIELERGITFDRWEAETSDFRLASEAQLIRTLRPIGNRT